MGHVYVMGPLQTGGPGRLPRLLLLQGRAWALRLPENIQWALVVWTPHTLLLLALLARGIRSGLLAAVISNKWPPDKLVVRLGFVEVSSNQADSPLGIKDGVVAASQDPLRKWELLVLWCSQGKCAHRASFSYLLITKDIHFRCRCHMVSVYDETWLWSLILCGI